MGGNSMVSDAWRLAFCGARESGSGRGGRFNRRSTLDMGDTPMMRSTRRKYFARTNKHSTRLITSHVTPSSPAFATVT